MVKKQIHFYYLNLTLSLMQATQIKADKIQKQFSFSETPKTRIAASK